ncbi:MAG: hypothetical protein M3386_08750, partial [Actinomycetota bacterium]|nr:hypothetical protein [Actinomycetota bacterium]
MTDLQVEPALVELAKVLTDVETLAVPAALHDISAAASGDDPAQESSQARGQIDQRQAARLARIAADDVVDTVIGTWGVLAPELSAPAMVRLEWFAREAERRTVALPEASATARTHLSPEVVEAARWHLSTCGWQARVDELPGGRRLLARKGHVYLEAQVRGLMGLVLLRARTAPLPLGQVGADLRHKGSQLRTW